MPPQSVPVLRQPYPANFIPYGHYYHPFYMPPIHQYLSHNGFPQQPSTGNVYLTPAPNASAAGVKSSLPQLKPGANAGNPAHIGIFGGSFIAPPVGHNPGSAVTSGSSTGIEDLSSSQMKENHVYTTGQLVGFVSSLLKIFPLHCHQVISSSISGFMCLMYLQSLKIL